MSDTQALLGRIAALRQQLEHVQGMAQDIQAADIADGSQRIWKLQKEVEIGSRHLGLVDSTLRQLAPEPIGGDINALPSQLTARARRTLERGHELLGKLRALADEFAPASALPVDGSGNPLARRYHETVAMTEVALRLLQAFPDAPSAQLRLCDGLDGILQVVVDRVSQLGAAVDQRRSHSEQQLLLGQLLQNVCDGASVPLEEFAPIAESLVTEAQTGLPLRFLHAGPEDPAQFVACHSLTVAGVTARLTRFDADFRAAPLEPVLAALLQDVGMIQVGATILSQQGSLDDEQRRAVEAHTRIGADLLARLYPSSIWLAESAAGHHERMDGTGYPGGLREMQIPSRARLLAVCDVYAALCSPRPYRLRRDTRTALTDTLVMAEKGELDRTFAERLLLLSFYPAGSAVELADGAIGVVVATHQGRRDLQTPSRPVLALLVDSDGNVLPEPQYVDLAQCEGRSIVRSLSPTQRRSILGKRYPGFAG